MKRQRITLIMISIMVLLLMGSASWALPRDKHILILNSYHQGFKWTDEITQGIINTLKGSRENVIISIEYMDTKRIAKDQYFQTLLSIYQMKYKDQHFDLILTSDNDAYNFLRKNRDSLFSQTPVVFCGVNFFDPVDLRGVTNFTGVSEDVDIKACLDIALKLNPNTKNVFGIIDRSTTGWKIHDRMVEIIRKYQPGISFTLLEDLTMEELIDKVGKLPPDSIVLLTIFFKDSAGRFFTPDEIMGLLTENCKAPLYGLWDFYLDRGIIGGMLTSGYSQGEAAAKIGLRILAGEKPENIPVLMESPNRYMFDYAFVKKFGINPSDLPKESIVINKPIGLKEFYYKNSVFVLGITIISMSIIAFIFLFSMIKLKKSAMEREKLIKKLEGAYIELKTTQSQVLQQEKMASIGQLAAGVAHEINNPMGFIISNLSSLKNYVLRFKEFIEAQTQAILSIQGAVPMPELEEKRKKLKIDIIIDDVDNLIKESSDGAERVKKIVGDLMRFSRTDEMEQKTADINAGIESTINIVWNELKYKATVKRDYGELPLITCNMGQLNQVFMNILVNAAHAIEKQGEITVKTWHENGSIHVRISDTGRGMTEEVVKRIFEPFFTTKEVGKGTGLGLSIAYDIVKKHQGEMLVKSVVGTGSSFTIIIPVS